VHGRGCSEKKKNLRWEGRLWIFMTQPTSWWRDEDRERIEDRRWRMIVHVFLFFFVLVFRKGSEKEVETGRKRSEVLTSLRNVY